MPESNDVTVTLAVMVGEARVITEKVGRLALDSEKEADDSVREKDTSVREGESETVMDLT